MKQELTLSFGLAGVVQRIFYEPEEGVSTIEGTGLWQELGQLRLNNRRKRFAFAICVHLTSNKQQVGSISGICPGPATKHRAIFYAMKQLALHVIEKTPVALYDGKAWTNWKPHVAFEAFPDLFTGLEFEDFDHVWPLLFSQKELEQNDLRRITQSDTQKLADRTGKLFEPTEILDSQSHVNDDAHSILLSAGERNSILLKDEAHFL